MSFRVDLIEDVMSDLRRDGVSCGPVSVWWDSLRRLCHYDPTTRGVSEADIRVWWAMNLRIRSQLRSVAYCQTCAQ